MTTKKTAAVYAGHGVSINGAFDSGCVYKNYTEAMVAELVAKSCIKYLKMCGVSVISDIPGNRINMVKQVEKSNAANANIHVAFHCDYSKAPKGTIPLYFSESGRKLASRMNKHVLRYTSLTTRGLSKRDDLYELKATKCPAVIFEIGSIKADISTMMREYDAIGFGAARGICEHLGFKFKCKQYKLIHELAIIEKKVLKEHYKYNQNANIHKKTINCAEFVSWGLRKIGIIPSGESIWLGNKLHGAGANNIKAHCKVTHPNKKWNKCGLQIGDIVGFQWGNPSSNKVHTMVLVKFDNGRPIWATCGGSDIKARDLMRRRKIYEKRPIKTLIRMK